MIQTAKWGDAVLPAFPATSAQQPDFSDISSLVDKFRGLAGAPVKARAMLQPNQPDPNLSVGFGSISAAVDAFLGRPYPFEGPVACP